MTEYSGMRFLFFFFAEWGNLYVIGAIAATLFLGGWQIPAAIFGVVMADHPLLKGVLEFTVFFIKAYMWAFVAMWVRGTLPRVRVDQLMAMCWEIHGPHRVRLHVRNDVAVGALARREYRADRCHVGVFGSRDPLFLLAGGLSDHSLASDPVSQALRVGSNDRPGETSMNGVVEYFQNVRDTVTSIFEGMSITFSHFVRKPSTIQYPDRIAQQVQATLPLRYRGILEVDMDICTGCLACERVCPINCIAIGIEKDAETNQRDFTQFDIDICKCMYCGLCQEACPTGSIRHTQEFEGACNNPAGSGAAFRHRDSGPLQAEEGRGNRISNGSEGRYRKDVHGRGGRTGEMTARRPWQDSRDFFVGHAPGPTADRKRSNPPGF